MNSQYSPEIPEMNPAELCREEVFTDRRIGTIRRITPVRPDGTVDPGRPVHYAGQAQMMTPAGTLPLSFEIEAESLEEAVGKFAATAREEVARTLEELEALHREASSSILIPESGAGGLGGPGGIPGGGKIQFP